MRGESMDSYKTRRKKVTRWRGGQTGAIKEAKTEKGGGGEWLKGRIG